MLANGLLERLGQPVQLGPKRAVIIDHHLAQLPPAQLDLIDVVVVYNIDRLSRALVDFAKLVEVFDGNSVTIVSAIAMTTWRAATERESVGSSTSGSEAMPMRSVGRWRAGPAG